MTQPSRNTEQLISCLKVEVRGLHDAYVLIVSTNEDHTAYESRIFYYPEFPNQEGQVLLGLPTWLVDFTVELDGTIHAIGADGQVWRRTPDEMVSAQRLTTAPLSRICGPLETDTLVVVGDEGRVFALATSGWRELPPPTATQLLDVTARSPNDLYVCGMRGLFAHWDGTGWTKLELSTDSDLRTVAHHPHGSVAVGGAAGLLFVGSREEGFERISGVDSAISSICPFRTGFLVAVPEVGFYYLEGKTISLFKPELAPERVAANGNVAMASAGGEVLVFTGKQWLSLPVF